MQGWKMYKWSARYRHENRRARPAGAALVVVLGAALALCALRLPAADGFVWWEAETAAETNFPRQTWLSAAGLQGKGEQLSGGQWLTNDGKRQGAAGYAKYTVSVPADGEYDLWTRKFWKHGPFQWKFDGGAWTQCSRDCVLADTTPLITNVCANWVHLGKVKLARGEHRYELELAAGPGEELTAAFDCFLLTPQPFTPRGKLKPGEKTGLANPGYFPWEPEADAHTAAALLDLRGLNEKIAGEAGFVKKSGDGFQLGNGKGMKFWGVNAGHDMIGLPHGAIDALARSLAKRGVNIVRLHGGVFDAADPAKVDAEQLSSIQYFVTAMKKEGIYCTISFYFPLWFGIRPNYGIAGYDPNGQQKPFAILFYEAKMQSYYKAWLKAILTTPNPHSADRKPLGQEPAVAMVELLNEDSLFFWTFSAKNVPAPHWAALETKFGGWLKTKYGSVDKAFQTWGEQPGNTDDAKAGRVGLFDAWFMTSGAIKNYNEARKKRIGDQVHFLADTQRGFYAEMVKHCRQDLKAQNLICPGNWTVADAAMLKAIEQHTYTAGDVIDMHGYFDREHRGRDKNDGTAGYSVQVGHTFKNLSALHFPEQLPLQLSAVTGYPAIISEIGWTNPNLYRADYSFLAAGYGSLQGMDGYFAFALGGADWDQTLGKFAASSPAILGNFPAYALAYRRGDIQEGPVVVHESLKLEDLYSLKGSGSNAEQAFDQLRAQDVPPGGVAAGPVTGIDPLAFYCGRVVKDFAGTAGASMTMNLEKLIDREKKTIVSATGQLHWQYGAGLATIDAPRIQAAAGFLSAAGGFSLSGMKVELKNEYGTVAAIALDDQPLKSSKKILLQIMTIERPYGFKTDKGKDGRITDLGSGPMGVEQIAGTVTVALEGRESAAQLKITALDENGYPTKKVVKTTATGTGLQIECLPDVVYYVIER